MYTHTYIYVYIYICTWWPQGARAHVRRALQDHRHAGDQKKLIARNKHKDK